MFRTRGDAITTTTACNRSLPIVRFVRLYYDIMVWILRVRGRLTTVRRLMRMRTIPATETMDDGCCAVKTIARGLLRRERDCELGRRQPPAKDCRRPLRPPTRDKNSKKYNNINITRNWFLFFLPVSVHNNNMYRRMQPNPHRVQLIQVPRYDNALSECLCV